MGFTLLEGSLNAAVSVRSSDEVFSVDEVSRPPRPLDTPTPDYRPSAEYTGYPSELAVIFTVDEEGEVSRVNSIINTSGGQENPEFAEKVIGTLENWKFKPARRKGKPVKAYLPQLFIYRPENLMADMLNSEDSINLRSAWIMGGLISSFKPPKSRFTYDPLYPVDRLLENESGFAEIAIQVSHEGKVLRTRILNESHPDFGGAAVAACLHGTYRPARLGSETIPFALKKRFDFDSSRLNEHELMMLNQLKEQESELAAASPKLDRYPEPLSVVRAIYPPDLLEDGVEGGARLKLLLDEKGKVWFPQVVKASRPEFGHAALFAIQHWKFTSPAVENEPVMALVKIQFYFKVSEAEQGLDSF